jgi:hypothetical protein
MTLPKISTPPTATELRDRALAAMNGESSQLSAADQERRRRVLGALADAAERRAG